MANGTFQRVHIEPEVENEMESQGNSEKKIPLVQRSLRARLKNKRKDKNYSKMDTQELPNRYVQISMFESAEFLTAKMEKMKAEMDKYLKHKIAPEKTKKEKKKNDEHVDTQLFASRLLYEMIIDHNYAALFDFRYSLIQNVHH